MKVAETAGPLRADNVAEQPPGVDVVPYNLTVAEAYVEPIEPFAAQFASLVIRAPPSVRVQMVERLERKHYAANSTEPGARAVIEKTLETYERKKKSGAAAAAARRAKAKEARQARGSEVVSDEADEVDAED